MDINIFKILVLGEAGVGKTCLLRRFIDDRFSYQSNTTIGCDFGTCTMEVSGNRVRLEVWDTAGEERFHSMRQNFYRGAHGILLVYDITWGGSFRNMAHWLHEVRHHCPRRANILLVGNKCDALERREVPYEEGSRFAEYCGITFCEASAMSGDNVKKSSPPWLWTSADAYCPRSRPCHSRRHHRTPTMTLSRQTAQEVLHWGTIAVQQMGALGAAAAILEMSALFLFLLFSQDLLFWLSKLNSG